MSQVWYIAGSDYYKQERNTLEKIAGSLKVHDYNAFIPHIDGLKKHTCKLSEMLELSQTSLIDQAQLALNTYQIAERCNGLILNMNGRVPEESSVFRTSLAFSFGKPVIIYKNDDRSTFYGRDNAMLIGLANSFSTVKSIDKIPEKIASLNPEIQHESCPAFSGNSAELIEIGRKIWQKIENLKSDADLAPLVRVIKENCSFQEVTT